MISWWCCKHQHVSLILSTWEMVYFWLATNTKYNKVLFYVSRYTENIFHLLVDLFIFCLAQLTTYFLHMEPAYPSFFQTNIHPLHPINFPMIFSINFTLFQRDIIHPFFYACSTIALMFFTYLMFNL